MPYGPGTYGSKVGRPRKPMPGGPKPSKRLPAKKLSPGQKKIAGMAGDRKKIDAPDFSALRRKK